MMVVISLMRLILFCMRIFLGGTSHQQLSLLTGSLCPLLSEANSFRWHPVPWRLRPILRRRRHPDEPGLERCPRRTRRRNGIGQDPRVQYHDFYYRCFSVTGLFIWKTHWLKLIDRILNEYLAMGKWVMTKERHFFARTPKGVLCETRPSEA